MARRMNRTVKCYDCYLCVAVDGVDASLGTILHPTPI